MMRGHRARLWQQPKAALCEGGEPERSTEVHPVYHVYIKGPYAVCCCSDRKAFQAADLLLLRPQAGKDGGGSASSSGSITDLLCLVEKAEREAGQRHSCTVEALVCSVMKGSDAAGATLSSKPLLCHILQGAV